MIKKYARINFTLGGFVRTNNIEDLLNEASFNVDYFYGVTDQSDLKSSFNFADYTPTPKDKLYLVSGVTIPRSKVKNLKEDYSITSVRNLDKATHIVTSEKVINNYLESEWDYKAKTELFKKWMTAFLEIPAIANDTDYYFNQVKTKIKEFILNYHEEYVFIAYWTNSNFLSDDGTTGALGLLLEDSNGKFHSTAYGMDHTDYAHTYFFKIDNGNHNEITTLLNTGLPFVDQNQVIELLNGEDATSLDEDMFESICDMFESSDDDNKIIGMEIMANCHYRSSILWLTLLFYKYGGQMEYIHERKHVNFKSLASYMDLDVNNLRLDIDDVVKRLKSGNSLTKANLDIVLKYAGTDILHRGETDVIKVKEVTLSEEFLKEMNINYIYEYQPDFEPLVLTTEVEEESVPESEDLTIEYVQTGDIQVETKIVPNTDISSVSDNYLESNLMKEEVKVIIPEDQLDEEPEKQEEAKDDEYFL